MVTLIVIRCFYLLCSLHASSCVTAMAVHVWERKAPGPRGSGNNLLRSPCCVDQDGTRIPRVLSPDSLHRPLRAALRWPPFPGSSRLADHSFPFLWPFFIPPDFRRGAGRWGSSGPCAALSLLQRHSLPRPSHPPPPMLIRIPRFRFLAPIWSAGLNVQRLPDIAHPWAPDTSKFKQNLGLLFLADPGLPTAENGSAVTQ